MDYPTLVKYPTLVLPNKFTEISTKKIDIRQHKEYALVLRLYLRVPIQHDDRDTVPWARDHIIPVLRPLREDIPEVSSLMVTERYDQAHAYFDQKVPSALSIDISVRFNADRPSKIISEEKALTILGGTAALLVLIRSAMLQAQHVSDQKYTAAQIKEEANSLARSVANKIVTRATTAMRYDQRLAALKAERKAEIAATKKAALAEILVEERADWDDDEEWFQAVLTNATKVLDKQIEQHELPSFFRGMAEPLLSTDDVELADDFKARRPAPVSPTSNTEEATG